jgi:hypothetical protein
MNILKNLLFTLCFVAATASHAASEQLSCKKLFTRSRTAIESYRELALDDKLINQLDPRLERLNLIVPDGGLCATTCAVNVLRSFYEFLELPHSTFRADRRIRDMARFARDELNVDARMGLGLDDTAKVMKMMAARLEDFTLNTNVKHGPINEADLTPYHDELNIISVSTRHPAIYHALVVLEIYPESKQIVISDPNEEGKILYTFYEFVQHEMGWTTIKIYLHPFGPESEGHVISVLHVQPIF